MTVVHGYHGYQPRRKLREMSGGTGVYARGYGGMLFTVNTL